MSQEQRNGVFLQFGRLNWVCEKHAGEVANLLVAGDEGRPPALACALCLPVLEETLSREQVGAKSLKMALLQVHQSCSCIGQDVSTSAFVDHHVSLIRALAHNHFRELEPLLQPAITNYFTKTRDIITGKYFQEFYNVMGILVALRGNKDSTKDSREVSICLQKLLNFVWQFEKMCSECEEDSTWTLEQKMKGVSLVAYIKGDIGSIYKQFREKALGHKKHWQQQQILDMFNPFEPSLKSFRFSTTLLHPSLKVTDPKSLRMPNIPDNENNLLALLEPSIGNKKRSIKLKMVGIKGWVSAGIAYRKAVESYGYRFEQPNHGTVQISYDGYSWGSDSTVNQQYTSWYFNQNDILTITANPAQGQLVFMRNSDPNTYTLKFSKQKKQKIHFCVSVNYSGDEVAIVQ